MQPKINPAIPVAGPGSENVKGSRANMTFNIIDMLGRNTYEQNTRSERLQPQGLGESSGLMIDGTRFGTDSSNKNPYFAQESEPKESEQDAVELSSEESFMRNSNPMNLSRGSLPTQPQANEWLKALESLSLALLSNFAPGVVLF